MTLETHADTLRQHHAAASDALCRAGAAIDGGPDAMLGANAGLRAEMAAALDVYQRFKHVHIFDPAIASGDGSASCWRAT